MTAVMERRPISFRADPDATYERATRSFSRAALIAARRVRDKSARNAWRDDGDVDLVLRSPVDPSSISGADTIALATIKLALLRQLFAVSAAANVIARSLGLSFDRAAQITVPTLTMPTASWTGEGQPINVVQGLTSAKAVLTPSKIAVITTLTREMIESSNAVPIIQQLMIENCGPTLDAAMFSANVGTPGLQPDGILNGIAPLAPSSGAATIYDAMINDVGSLVQAVSPASGAGLPIIIATPKQWTSLNMALRDPLAAIPSAALPVGTVVAVIPQALATVVEAPRLEASAEAGALHMDDQPAEIVDASGTYAKPVISVFQTDSTALKMVLPATWALRSPSAVAWLQGANW